MIFGVVNCCCSHCLPSVLSSSLLVCCQLLLPPLAAHAMQLVKQEVAFFDTTPVGELSNRLSEDTRAMKDAATTSISLALR
jgi:hypothetical protein